MVETADFREVELIESPYLKTFPKGNIIFTCLYRGVLNENTNREETRNVDKDKVLNEKELSLVNGGAKQDVVELTGTVIETLPNAQIRVELSNGSIITTHASGKLRMSYIKFSPGDKVNVELPPHDTTRGIIVGRHK